MAKGKDPKDMSDEEFEELLRQSSIAGPYDADKVDELKDRIDRDQD